MGVLDEPTIWPTVRIMTPRSIARIAFLFLVLAAASGAAVVSGILYETQPSVETKSATTAAAVAPRAGTGEEGSAAFERRSHLPSHPVCATAATPSCRRSNLRSLGERVTQLSLGRLSPVLLWSYCAMASPLSKRLQINSGSSS